MIWADTANSICLLKSSLQKRKVVTRITVSTSIAIKLQNHQHQHHHHHHHRCLIIFYHCTLHIPSGTLWTPAITLLTIEVSGPSHANHFLFLSFFYSSLEKTLTNRQRGSLVARTKLVQKHQKKEKEKTKLSKWKHKCCCFSIAALLLPLLAGDGDGDLVVLVLFFAMLTRKERKQSKLVTATAEGPSLKLVH